MNASQWVNALLGVDVPGEGESVVAHGHKITTVAGIPRSAEFVSAAQEQTRETFGFKWAKRDTFEGSVADHMRTWLVQKYGDVPHASWFFKDHGPNPIILDAGCGAALSGIALFGPVMDRVRYLGVDVSTAVDVAKKRFEERGWQAGFIQSDLNPDNAALYLSEAVCYDDDKIREVALKLIGENIDTLDGSTLLQLPPDCFQDAISFGAKQKQDHDDCVLSALVSRYCITHQSYIDRDYLISLTDHFNQIDPQSSLSFLNLLQDLQQTSHDTLSSSPLYQKCIRAVTSQWKHVLIQPSKKKQDATFYKLYQSLSLIFVLNQEILS